MTCSERPVFFEYRERRLRMERRLGNTTCSKGHVHPPWNTTGILRIAKCETVCGFCQKETKTAANLRKHVAIHIKNEGLDLAIAEGSSGRGRLEMPPSRERKTSSAQTSHPSDDAESIASASNNSPPQRRGMIQQQSEPFSPTTVMSSMQQRQPHPGLQTRASYPSTSTSSLLSSTSQSQPSNLPVPITFTYPYSSASSSSNNAPPLFPTLNAPYPVNSIVPPTTDPFRVLREHKIRTKTAWTVIPSAEGLAILDFCKTHSVAQPASQAGGNISAPCYNRETLFDEEWQAHMRDVHGVFLLWPETWMRRIEVLDLEPFGGDIGGVNVVIMES